MSSYLCTFLFWLELSLGLLGILMIGHLTGGRWFRHCESILTAALPCMELLAVLFVPVLFSLHQIYPWAAGPEIGPETALRRDFFLNPSWFRVRAVCYWILWVVLARALRSSRSRSKLLNGVGLAVLVFSTSFAAMDWLMTLDPNWSSTGFGITFISSALIAGFCFLTIAVVGRTGRQAPMRDYGNLLLMSILFWIYVNFLQYLIIWSGNIPREINWYHARSSLPYAVLLALVIAFGLCLPFLTLLFKKAKENPTILVGIAGTLWFLRWLELMWLNFPGQSLDLPLAGITSLLIGLAIGIAWLKFFQIHQAPDSVNGGLGV